MRDHTPVLVGVGQYVGRDMSNPELLLSPVEIATTVARRALADAGAAEPLAAQVDTLAVVRMFEHSVGDRAMWPNPFGSTDNVPWSVAKRLHVTPRHAIYAEVGGQSPQRLINTLAERIFAGDVRMALLTGAEAIATIRDAMRRGLTLDWREEATGEFEDRWPGTPFVTPYERRHGIAWPIHVYALFEQVRRHARGLSLAAYRTEMAELLAPFSAVAATHPYAQFPVRHDVEFLHTISARNYLLCEPYTKWMVAQDAVNQGAAVVLTSVKTARELGIPEARWVYLTGYADVDDVTVLERPNLAASKAQNLAVRTALEAAGIDIAAIKYLDFYSCFPIAVSSIVEPLGLATDGTRALTVTGGLPYFGGPGNNYSMHAIATVVDRLRADRDAHGLVVANGGYLSKHSAGIYSGRPPIGWQPVSSSAAQAEAKAGSGIQVAESARGRARIESYAAIHAKAESAKGIPGKEAPAKELPVDVFVVARMEQDGARCMARLGRDDAAGLAGLSTEHVIGRPIMVTLRDDMHEFTLTTE